MQNVFAPHDHANCTHSALTTVERACAERGLRLTPIRKRTLEILLEGHHALGAYDVLQKLSDDGLADKPPMAYRALNFFGRTRLRTSRRTPECLYCLHASGCRSHASAVDLFGLSQGCGNGAGSGTGSTPWTGGWIFDRYPNDRGRGILSAMSR